MLEDIGYIVDYNNADPYYGPVTPSVPNTQTITISRQASVEEKQFLLSYNNLINNHPTSPITESTIYHYVYGNPYYNVTGNIEIVDNGSLIPLSTDTPIVNNGKDLLLQYTLPVDSSVTRETFYYTVFYETPNNVIIQSNNCLVTINITE
jgi:hypothetical protein